MDASTSPAIVSDNESEMSDNESRAVTPTSLPNPTYMHEFSVMDQFMIRDIFRIIELGEDSLDELYNLLTSKQMDGLSTTPRNCVAIGCRFCLEKGTSSERHAIIIPRDFSDYELLEKIEGELKCHCESCDNFPYEVRNEFDELNDFDDYTPNHIWRALLQSQGVFEFQDSYEEDGKTIKVKGLIFDE